jgi:hypothetical protein
MNAVHKRWTIVGLGALALTLLQACAVEGVGVDGSVGVGYGGGYYEPYGYDYGGWGGGYRVGPGWGGDRRGGHPSGSYRPAPASRATPSIPRGSGGSHGGSHGSHGH